MRALVRVLLCYGALEIVSVIIIIIITKEDGILIKVLRQSKGYSARKLLKEFPGKEWSYSALDRLLRQIDATTGVCRQEVRQQQRTYGLHNRHASVCANGDHFEHKLDIVYELLRRLFHIGNFCFFEFHF